MGEQRLPIGHQEIEYAELRDFARQHAERGEHFVERRLRTGEGFAQALQQRAKREFAVGIADRLIDAAEHRLEVLQIAVMREDPVAVPTARA